MVYPEQLVQEYHNLWVAPLRWNPAGKPRIVEAPPIPAPITNYKSNLDHWRQEVRENIRRYLNGKSKSPDSGIHKLGDMAWGIDSGQFSSIPYYTDVQLLHSLSGKGTPQEIRDTMKIASLMLDEKTPNPDLLGCPDLHTFRDWFIGLDCNGLIFSYLRLFHGWSETWDHKPRWYTKGKRKRTLDEIEELDFIFKWEGVDHIAIIGHILSRTSDKIECLISESRGHSHGGAQTNYWRIERDGSKFDSTNLDRGGTRPVDEVWRFPAIA